MMIGGDASPQAWILSSWKLRRPQNRFLTWPRTRSWNGRSDSIITPSPSPADLINSIDPTRTFLLPADPHFFPLFVACLCSWHKFKPTFSNQSGWQSSWISYQCPLPLICDGWTASLRNALLEKRCLRAQNAPIMMKRLILVCAILLLPAIRNLPPTNCRGHLFFQSRAFGQLPTQEGLVSQNCQSL